MQGEPFATVQGDDFLGAIIPAERIRDQTYFFGEWDGFWTPSAAEVDSLEGGLPAALTSVDCSPYVRDNLKEYRRQYVGVIVGGQRRILVNAFRVSDEDGRETSVVR